MILRWLTVSLAVGVAAGRAELTIPEPTPTNSAPQLVVPEPVRSTGTTNRATELPATTAIPITPLNLVPLGIPWPTTDRLMLTNNERFVGSLQAVVAGNLLWQESQATNLVRIRPASLSQLELATPPAPHRPVTDGWLVGLTDGSLLRARQVTWAGDRLTAELPVAGRVTLERRQVAALRRVAPGLNELVSLADAPVYGPADRNTHSSFCWRYRDVELPEHLLIEFAWRPMPQLMQQIRLFGGPPDEAGLRLALSMSMWAFNIYSEAGKAPISLALLGGLTNLQGRTSWMALTINRATGETTWLQENQQRVRSSLPEQVKFHGRGLMVQVNEFHPSLLQAVILSRLEPVASFPEIAPGHDTLVLANYDAIAGTLEAVTTNAIVFHSTLGRVELPLERVGRVVLSRTAASAGAAGQALLALATGETLGGTVLSMDRHSWIVTNSILGAVALPRDSVFAMNWTPDNPTERPDNFSPIGRNSFMVYSRSHGNQLGSLVTRSRQTYAGTLAGIAGNVVSWQSPATLEPIQFRLDQVARVITVPQPWPGTTNAPVATVRLRNGNVMTGPVAAADPQHITVTTPYAGRLTVPCASIAGISSNTVPNSLMEQGPTPVWRSDEKTPFEIDNGIAWLGDLRQMSLYRELQPMDRIRIDMETTWSPETVTINLMLFSKGPKQNLDYYQVMLNDGAVAFITRRPNYNMNEVRSPTVMTNLTARGQGRWSVLADRKTGEVRVYLDGHLAAQWRAAAAARPDGNWIELFAGWGMFGAGPGTFVAVRHIAISEWSEWPASASDPLPPAASISRGPTEALLVLHNGDRISLDELRWEQDMVTGRHPLLGPVTMSSAAVRVIDWPEPERSTPKTAPTR